MYGIYGLPFTINIPPMLASIYHTYGSIMGYFDISKRWNLFSLTYHGSRVPRSAKGGPIFQVQSIGQPGKKTNTMNSEKNGEATHNFLVQMVSVFVFSLSEFDIATIFFGASEGYWSRNLQGLEISGTLCPRKKKNEKAWDFHMFMSAKKPKPSRFPESFLQFSARWIHGPFRSRTFLFPWRIRMYGIYGNIYHQYTPKVSIYHTYGSVMGDDFPIFRNKEKMGIPVFGSTWDAEIWWEVGETKRADRCLW